MVCLSRLTTVPLVCWALCGALPAPILAAPAVPLRYHQDAEPLPGLLAAGIGDIKWSGRYLWVATTSGVARLDPSQGDGLDASDWTTYTELNGIGRGGISALDAVGDTIWIATVYDTTLADQDYNVSGGLSYSHDGGDTWQQLPNEAIFNPANPGFEEGPTTPIQNPCWGLSISGSTIWAAFFSGSSVRSLDAGQTWERALPGGGDDIVYSQPSPAADSLAALADSLAREDGPEDEIYLLRTRVDSLRTQTLLHRTFAVLARGDTVWIGTSSGVTRSFDGGATWMNIKVRHDREGQLLAGNISANWVVALERQILPDGGSVIWAGTRSTGLPGEVSAISFSRDQGETWEISGPPSGTDEPTFAWDFAFSTNKVWAGAEAGLLVSPDQGATWDWVVVEDVHIRQQLSGTVVGVETLGDTVWAGAENGLGVTPDEGQTWHILNALIKTLSVDTREEIGPAGLLDPEGTRVYAAPNPFAPSQDERARLVYSLARDTEVTIKIYDFASRLVRTLIEDESRAGQHNHGENWDGRDDEGDLVANGVYLYRIELTTGEQAFGKVVVLD